MRIGINGSGLLGRPSIDSLVDHAVQAEADGFSSWWLAQTGLVDALSVFIAAAGRATSIEFGTAVIPTYIRHPQTIAAQALTTSATVGDRLVLGIGLSHKPVVEHRWGMEFERPVRHASEYLRIVNELFEDGSVAFDGDFFTNHGDYALFADAPKPSVMFAGLGPQMLKLTGRRTDGTILWMVGAQTIADHIGPAMREAADTAGRGAPRIVTGLPVVVTDDEAGMRKKCDEMFELYGQLPSYRAMLDREGAEGPGAVCVVGNEDSVREQLGALAAAGSTDFGAVEIGTNPDEIARTRELLKQVAAEA